MATEKALRAAATVLSKVLDLEPAINAKAKLSILTKEVEEAVSLINPAEGDTADKFTEETLEVIAEINPELYPEEEEAPKPVKKGTKKAAPVEEEEEEQEEEVKPVKKVVKKAAPVEEDEEAEEEEEVKPAKKGAAAPAKKGATPFTSTKESLGTTRMIEVAKAMQNINGAQTIDKLAELADKSFMKAGGKANLKQNKNIIKVLLPAATEWGIVVVKKDGKLSNE